MIAKNNPNNQLPNEIKSTFKELNMFKHLRNAGITKSFGFSCAYIFQLIFCLIFEHKNWFQTLEGKRATDVPAKDTVYRFLNQSTFNWRRFLLLLVAHTAQKISKLTRHDRPRYSFWMIHLMIETEANMWNFWLAALIMHPRKCASIKASAC